MKIDKDILELVNDGNILFKLWSETDGERDDKIFEKLERTEALIDFENKKREKQKILAGMFIAAASIFLVALATFKITSNVLVPEQVEYMQSFAEKGQIYGFDLPDGTHVILNSGSSLIYPESFNGKTRMVFLDGEANFAVAKNPDCPFMVKTSYLTVKAIGTRFCVNSYPEDKMVKVTLEEGKVVVKLPAVSDESYFLDPDMQLSYNIEDESIVVNSVDAKSIASWKNGRTVFYGASFEEIANVLSRRYDTEIFYDADINKTAVYNIRINPDESLEDALEILSVLIPGSHYKILKNKVYYYFK